MSAELRNQIRNLTKDLDLLRAIQARNAEDVQQAALYALSDRVLERLVLPHPDSPAVADYGAALDLAAKRITGRPPPAWNLPRDGIAREIASRLQTKLHTVFPDAGPFRRELYPKQLEFFLAGRDHREVAFIAGNRCGKSEAGAYQTTLHLTGRYPDWWVGRRFYKPVNAWVPSDTNQTTRDILQAKLLGRKEGRHRCPWPDDGAGHRNDSSRRHSAHAPQIQSAGSHRGGGDPACLRWNFHLDLQVLRTGPGSLPRHRTGSHRL